ncbi:DUF4136 domain-containing protein [Adhaeribacter rhizoryzae]|uniref:DUF4136 domain-containing protein n=1 Tax=Adhaeribacter rhizoryzae TaxID=2607907 RepID=A0A5M6DTG6_9BACT|nr:DUF4136 domain-containing protein [Adhaeribacter rhizoryzae]KAA5548715.1 DUF4136 domain-containing protein [Adhaeribacter rhizoryzae]
MKNIKLILLGLLWLAACSAPVRILNTDSMPGFALTNYKTFNFYEVTTESENNDADYTNRINILKQSIQQELARKGLSLNPTNPDLLVNIGVVTREKVQTRQTDFRTDAPRYIGQRRYSWKSQEVEVGRYHEGTVTVHLVDAEKNLLVWKGAAQAVVPKKEAKLQKTVEAGVAKLFTQL